MSGKPAAGTKNDSEPEVTAKAQSTEPATPAAIRKAWEDFAETRKLQVAEYMVLRRPIVVEGQAIRVALTNPVEETLLQGIKSDLLIWIREALNDPTISLETELQVNTVVRAAFTNREKLEELQSRYPILGEFCDRLGLDPDY